MNERRHEQNTWPFRDGMNIRNDVVAVVAEQIDISLYQLKANSDGDI